MALHLKQVPYLSCCLLLYFIHILSLSLLINFDQFALHKWDLSHTCSQPDPGFSYS